MLGNLVLNKLCYLGSIQWEIPLREKKRCGKDCCIEHDAFKFAVTSILSRKLPDVSNRIFLNDMKGVVGIFILLGVDQILKESFCSSNIDQEETLSEKSLQLIEIILRYFFCCFG